MTLRNMILIILNMSLIRSVPQKKTNLPSWLHLLPPPQDSFLFLSGCSLPMLGAPTPWIPPSLCLGSNTPVWVVPLSSTGGQSGSLGLGCLTCGLCSMLASRACPLCSVLIAYSDYRFNSICFIGSHSSPVYLLTSLLASPSLLT